MLSILQVKPNVGHSEGASGITSLIKATLALERGIIPPNINFETPNPKSTPQILCIVILADDSQFRGRRAKLLFRFSLRHGRRTAYPGPP